MQQVRSHSNSRFWGLGGARVGRGWGEDRVCQVLQLARHLFLLTPGTQASTMMRRKVRAMATHTSQGCALANSCRTG